MVGAVDFDNGHAGSGHVAGQTGSVAAGPLDPDHGDGPEAAQPGEQAGVAGRGGREALGAEDPPDPVERGGDMGVGVGVHTTGDGACLYDGQGHPFHWLRGWHALAGRPSCGPRPLV